MASTRFDEKAKYVLNPLTQRNIKVGKRVYRDLVRRGIIVPTEKSLKEKSRFTLVEPIDLDYSDDDFHSDVYESGDHDDSAADAALVSDRDDQDLVAHSKASISGGIARRRTK